MNDIMGIYDVGRGRRKTDFFGIVPVKCLKCGGVGTRIPYVGLL